MGRAQTKKKTRSLASSKKTKPPSRAGRQKELQGHIRQLRREIERCFQPLN